METLMENLKDHFVCTICSNLLVTPTQIQCGHIFCGPCIVTIQSSRTSTCPRCNVKVAKRSILVRKDVENLLTAIVFNFVPFALSKDNGNPNSTSPKPNGDSLNIVDNCGNSSSSDSDGGEPSLTERLLNRRKNRVAAKKAQENTNNYDSLPRSISPLNTLIELSGTNDSSQHQPNKTDMKTITSLNATKELSGTNGSNQQLSKKTESYNSSPKTITSPSTTKELSGKNSSNQQLSKKTEIYNSAPKTITSPSTTKELSGMNSSNQKRSKKSESYNSSPQTISSLNATKELSGTNGTCLQQTKKTDSSNSLPKTVSSLSMTKELSGTTPTTGSSQQQPIDLRVKRVKLFQHRPVVKQFRSALRYVRPMDLSMKTTAGVGITEEKMVNHIAVVVVEDETNMDIPEDIGAVQNTTERPVDTGSVEDLVETYFPEEPGDIEHIDEIDIPEDTGSVEDLAETYFPKEPGDVEHIDEIDIPEDTGSVEDLAETYFPEEPADVEDIAEIDVPDDKSVSMFSDSDEEEVEVIQASPFNTPKSVVNADNRRPPLRPIRHLSAGSSSVKAFTPAIPVNLCCPSEASNKTYPTAASPNSLKSISQTPQKFVFCPTRLTKLQLAKLNELCPMCDGTIVKEYTDDVSHLIINLENNRVPQTIKYLFAIADKKWIVTYDWVESCFSRNEMVGEEPYETSSFPECDSGVRKSRVSLTSLFTGINFYFAGVLKSSGASMEDCKKLMKKLGGRVIDSPYSEDENVMIIGDPLTMRARYQEWYRTKGWITVSWEWILDCILTYSVIPFSTSHLITTLDSSGLSQASLPEVLLNLYRL